MEKFIVNAQKNSGQNFMSTQKSGSFDFFFTFFTFETFLYPICVYI